MCSPSVASASAGMVAPTLRLLIGLLRVAVEHVAASFCRIQKAAFDTREIIEPDTPVEEHDAEGCPEAHAGTHGAPGPVDAARGRLGVGVALAQAELELRDTGCKLKMPWALLRQPSTESPCTTQERSSSDMGGKSACPRHKRSTRAWQSLHRT